MIHRLITEFTRIYGVIGLEVQKIHQIAKPASYWSKDVSAVYMGRILSPNIHFCWIRWAFYWAFQDSEEDLYLASCSVYKSREWAYVNLEIPLARLAGASWISFYLWYWGMLVYVFVEPLTWSIRARRGRRHSHQNNKNLFESLLVHPTHLLVK